MMAAILQWRLTGGAANADPDDSLGGVRSSEQISSTALNNLFDNVSVAEAVAGSTEYRALDLYNAGDQGAIGVEVWMSTQTSSPDTHIEFGEDALGSTLEIVNETTAPIGITFDEYLAANHLSLPDIGVGEGCRVWFKRVVAEGAGNTSLDLGTISVNYA
jgi:hypothetical protein